MIEFFISIPLSTPVLSFSRCNKNLASKDGLRRHMESVHETIGKNFVCPTCGNRFLRKEYLAKHLKTHEFNYEVLPADTTTVSASPSVSSWWHTFWDSRIGVETSFSNSLSPYLESSEKCWRSGYPSDSTGADRHWKAFSHHAARSAVCFRYVYTNARHTHRRYYSSIDCRDEIVIAGFPLGMA